MRKDGFYWIRLRATHRFMEVARFVDGFWYLTGVIGYFSDEDLAEIDELMLEHEEPTHG